MSFFTLFLANTKTLINPNTALSPKSVQKLVYQFVIYILEKRFFPNLRPIFPETSSKNR